jgi:hypothetical protein
MASNLYPLVFKPGIKRDGTSFQAEYCTDGQWIRFYRGMVKKIGGMLALPYTNNGGRYNNINTLFINYFNNQINVLLGDDQGLYRVVTNANFGQVVNIAQLVINPNIGQDPNRLWQFVPVLSSIGGIPASSLAVLSTLNYTDILDDSFGDLININLADFSGTIESSVPRLATLFSGVGGMLYVAPRLYIYGSNGRVQWSANNNCYDFTSVTNSVNISTDKVIFGASIRGGSLTPTLLFWTMSSVVRLTNTTMTRDTGDNNLNFRADTISRDSSIMSSRCVVEYDGIFYWPGTNRFFIYNGVVLPLENNINRRYFFNNIDMNFRQRVFGVKNVAFGEIWWFYPEKVGTVGRPNVAAGTNTRAIIYNIEENAWYDTQILRDCGFFDNVSGNMYTYGLPLTNPVAGAKYTWKQEVGVNEVFGPNTPINSYFTTPTISWAAFNPMKQLTGVDRWMDLMRIEPDFLLDNPNDQMEVLVNIKEYANSDETTYPVNAVPIPFFGTTTKIDTHVQGRHITFTFFSSVNFEMGHIMLLLGVGDGR